VALFATVPAIAFSGTSTSIFRLLLFLDPLSAMHAPELAWWDVTPHYRAIRASDVSIGKLA